MKRTTREIILYSTLIIIGVCAFFWGLVEARSFLVPITVAGLLAMLVLPLSNWLERKGMNRGFAALLSDLVLLISCVALVGLVGLQMKSFASDWPQIKERIMPQVEQLQKKIAARTGLTVKEQNEQIGLQMITDELNGDGAKKSESEDDKDGKTEAASGSDSSDQADGSSKGSMVETAGSFIMGVFGFMGTFLLVFVYIFFFLLYRHKFSNTILKIVNDEDRKETRRVITDGAAISQKYIVGRLILIVCLAVLYSIGLSISGVKHAIIISVLAAILSLLPYVGNVVGFVLAISMAFFSGASTMGLLGVVITFGVAQFVESYILEPYVVGDRVNLSPIMVILVVVLGEAIWGLPGMVIAIPLLGILKVICDHVPVLEPFGYLLGQEKKKKEK